MGIWTILLVLSVIVVSITVILKIIVRYRLLKLIHRYERLREILIYDLGIIKAESFDYPRLERIYNLMVKDKEGCVKNPVTLYTIVSKTERDFDQFFD
jgi:hypothetical protein